MISGNAQLRNIDIDSIGFRDAAGTLTVDNSKISKISNETYSNDAYITINSGTIDSIYMYENVGTNYLQVNGGIINKIDYVFGQTYGGTLKIYGGEIENINIGDSIGVGASDGVIVGDPNGTVSKTSPYIHSMNDIGCTDGFNIQFNSGAIVNPNTTGRDGIVPRNGYTVTIEYNSDKKENVYVLTQ